MRREGYLIEEIVEQSNLEASFDDVVKGSKRKNSKEGRWLLSRRNEFLSEVRDEILSGHISLMPIHRNPSPEEKEKGGYHTIEVVEGGKKRTVQVFCMAARIKINAVMRVADRHIRKRFIHTTASSIKGRGTHYLKRIIERDLRRQKDIRYWYQSDIKKCYETVHQDFVIAAFRHVFKDKKFLHIIEEFTHCMQDGISIGMRSSQGSLNLLLSVYLDHRLKDRGGFLHYRYCDDNVSGARDKKTLWRYRNHIHECVEEVGQKIKPTERVFPAGSGIDFLGYVIRPSHTMMRKRVKKNFARKLKKIKSRKRRNEIIGSLWGIAKHCKSVNLLKTLLFPSEFQKIRKKLDKIRRQQMKNFSELGFVYRPADGKKRFPNRAVPLRQLVNVKIEVLDYEDGVKTRFGERCLVKFRDTRTNETAKFFTDCDEMKQALHIIDEMGEIPFCSVIEAEYFGEGKTKYKFT